MAGLGSLPAFAVNLPGSRLDLEMPLARIAATHSFVSNGLGLDKESCGINEFQARACTRPVQNMLIWSGVSPSAQHYE